MRFVPGFAAKTVENRLIRIGAPGIGRAGGELRKAALGGNEIARAKAMRRGRIGLGVGAGAMGASAMYNHHALRARSSGGQGIYY